MDLGHVTFGTVSDWSEEQEKNLEQGVLQATTETMETDDDDDGKPLSLSRKIKVKIYCYQTRSLPHPFRLHPVRPLMVTPPLC